MDLNQSIAGRNKYKQNWDKNGKELFRLTETPGGERKGRIQAAKVRTQVTWLLNKSNTGIQLALCRLGGKWRFYVPLSLPIPLLPPPVRSSLQFVTIAFGFFSENPTDTLLLSSH